MQDDTTRASFGGLEVALFESRRAAEIASLVRRFGGVPVAAPTIREAPLGDDGDARAFARELESDAFDAVVAMTG
ncbi:MAG TPA: uroporphyrinogen-III synthase, partial [Minicystis sp.]|nr:uroporphyrinogen-III synthase [Minicystis sp.]